MPHPATTQVLRFFDYEHLNGSARGVSQEFSALAWEMARILPEDPETTVALRKLLEAKDAAVRAALVGEGIVK